MGQLFLITWVGDRVNDYNGKYGVVKQYRIALNDHEGNECRGTKADGSESKTFQLGQKPETPAPQVGDKLFGHIKDGWRFEKEQQPEGQPPSSSASVGVGGTAQSAETKDPDHSAGSTTGASATAPGNQGGGQPPSAPARPSYTERKAHGAPAETEAERQWSIRRQAAHKVAAWRDGNLIAAVAAGIKTKEEVAPLLNWQSALRRVDQIQRDMSGLTPEPTEPAESNVTELPRADEKTALNLREAQDLAVAAQRKMSAPLLNNALRNVLGDRKFSNPVDAFMLFTPGMAFQFSMEYLSDDEAAA